MSFIYMSFIHMRKTVHGSLFRIPAMLFSHHKVYFQKKQGPVEKGSFPERVYNFLSCSG